jgi:hypothetical protein
MNFLILLIVLVTLRNLTELVTTLSDGADFWAAHNHQIFWIMSGLVFGVYALTRPVKGTAIGMALLTILAVLLADYFIEGLINQIQHPYQDWKTMLAFGAVFLFIPGLVCGLASFLLVIGTKLLLSRGQL